MKTHFDTTNPNLVSVVIPCYNAEKTLAKTVESVCLQSYKNWEIIIVNDGSTDNSRELADHLAESINIRVIHTPNSGVSSARNTGAEYANGEYIAFLDADDIWHPEKLQIQVDYFLAHQKVGVCFSKVRFTNPSGESLNQYSSVPKRPLSGFSLLLENHLCTSSNIMCRKQAFLENGGFEQDMNYAEDQEWLLRMALQDRWHIAGVQQVLVDYRTQVGSLSSSLEKMEQGWECLIRKVDYYAPEFIEQNRTIARAFYLRYLARRALRQGELAEIGLSYIKRALASDWAILVISPWRSFATLTGLICWQIAPTENTAKLFQISRKAG